jgi:hypothetical protein
MSANRMLNYKLYNMKIWVLYSGLEAEIQTGYIPNTKQECELFHRDSRLVILYKVNKKILTLIFRVVSRQMSAGKKYFCQ